MRWLGPEMMKNILGLRGWKPALSSALRWWVKLRGTLTWHSCEQCGHTQGMNQGTYPQFLRSFPERQGWLSRSEALKSLMKCSALCWECPLSRFLQLPIDSFPGDSHYSGVHFASDTLKRHMWWTPITLASYTRGQMTAWQGAFPSKASSHCLQASFLPYARTQQDQLVLNYLLSEASLS